MYKRSTLVTIRKKRLDPARTERVWQGKRNRNRNSARVGLGHMECFLKYQ